MDLEKSPSLCPSVPKKMLRFPSLPSLIFLYMVFPTEFYCKHHFTPRILTFFVIAPESSHCMGDRTLIPVLPDHCAAAFLNKKTSIISYFKGFFPQLAHNSPPSAAFQSTFNDTQGCGVPRLVQVHWGFFIIILLFKLSTEKMKKREKIFFFPPIPFSSRGKKNSS